MSIFNQFYKLLRQLQLFDYQKHPDRPKSQILISLKYDYFTYPAPRYYIYKYTVQVNPLRID